MTAPRLHEAGWLPQSCLALLVIATSALTFWYACAVPFAAFAAFAAVALSGRDALRVVVALWLANQAIGYLRLGYPRTLTSCTGGLAIVGAAILSLLAAQRIAAALRSSPVIRPVAALGGAFAVYEAAIYVVALGLGGTSSLAPAIVGRILVVNVVTLAALLAVYRLGAAVGVNWRPVAAASAPAQAASS